MTDHVALIAVSKDGNHTFDGWTEHELGAEGAFQTRVVRRRMGVSRHFGIEVRVSSRYRSDLVGASFFLETES